jgi:hypothetical protein
MFARFISVGAAALGLSLATAGTTAAQQMQMEHPKGTKQTITGTVIDVSCRFGQGLTGASHRECAQVCAGKGIPLAILGSDGKLYVPASPSMPGEGQNDRLKDFAEQHVRVTGTVVPAGGANAIWIESIAQKS